VIGGGSAGLVTAAGAAGLGAKVALVERGLLGGDCLNAGCVPSKALIRSARVVAGIRRAADYGIVVPEGPNADFAAVMERMRKLRAQLSAKDSAARYRSLGVDVFIGRARFSGPSSVEVKGKTLRFLRAVIATGSRAAISTIPGLAETGYLTNETIFALTALPRRLAVIGAGPVGCELAQAFQRFGSNVTLLEAATHILPNEDGEAARIVRRALQRDGIEIVEGCDIRRVEGSGGCRLLHVGYGTENRHVLADEIVVCTGRIPSLDGLDLEAAGVDYDARIGVKVDDRLRTYNRRIFAAGDVCSPHKFTHVSDAMARIVVRNALFAGRQHFSSLTIPRCTYTDPEIAQVGLSEAEARQRGIAIRTFLQPLSEVDRAVLDGQCEGFVKVHAHRRTGQIVGATVVAIGAGEMISEFTLAMVGRFGLATIARTIYPYPTQAEAIRKVGDEWYRGPSHAPS
jgi:pyruvate/2-oxoglutarate dehydrogenase complex dihydrolipoamide dehydrogenase (E3) component